jgi:hypothetical protein
MSAGLADKPIPAAIAALARAAFSIDVSFGLIIELCPSDGIEFHLPNLDVYRK